MIVLLLVACASGPSGFLGFHNAVIRLVPADEVTDPPSGTVPVIEAGSSVAPVLDAPDRELGSLGFSGSLKATLTQGVHSVFALGDFDSHPGCEQPEEPQSTCTPAGWEGHTLVEVFGPDWGPDDAETSLPVVEIAEGEVGDVVITVAPSCACTD